MHFTVVENRQDMNRLKNRSGKKKKAYYERPTIFQSTANFNSTRH